MLRCLVGEKTKSSDLILAQTEFAYNNSVNWSTGRTPFEILIGIHPSGISELRDISNEDKRSAEAEVFVEHTKTIHT